MQNFTVCVFLKNQKVGTIYTAIPDRRPFLDTLADFFKKKPRLTENDLLLQSLFAKGTVIPAASFKNTMRLLRRYDEVGLCNDIHDVIEELYDEGVAEAIAFGIEWSGVPLDGIPKSKFLYFSKDL